MLAFLSVLNFVTFPLKTCIALIYSMVSECTLSLHFSWNYYQTTRLFFPGTSRRVYSYVSVPFIEISTNCGTVKYSVT